MIPRLPTLAIAGAIVAAAAPARADDVAAHALIVGSNAAGPGQSTLRYAEDDARRVGKILTELGGYAPGSVDIVTHPTPAVLRERLARLGQRVAADLAAGKQARVFFYYSGHARASAIDLGPEPLPLAELRDKLFATNATLTVVVLDACQSGAFSRVKGAEPAADFSFNSRQQLGAKGVAVLASSSGSELSQESEQLRSSYFTHHLLVGMRGAGDANGDGEVSVDEAYRYAYHQTLLSTAATAVGGQHVTLEVDLKGHGEVALSYPRAASAAIVLPGPLEGKALVSDRRARTVVAETQKAKGAAVRIAVAPGDYDVLVRQGDRLLRCPVTAPGAVDLSRCSNEPYVDAVSKGPSPGRTWRLSTGLALGNENDDAFTQTLENFGYHRSFGPIASSLSLALDVGSRWNGPRGHLEWTFVIDHVSAPEWLRDTELAPLRFGWSTTNLGAGARLSLFPDRWFYASAAVVGGLAIGRTRFEDQMNDVTTETFYGPMAELRAGAGIRNLIVPGLSLGLGVTGTAAYGIRNDIGDHHTTGGVFYGIELGYQRGGAR